ncbi:hypothetical protein H4582DRAFT_1854634 [Lactarius indigo]|nr:hypothetical protein H4582DRAFT_1854634 [Lactarius indigo]
MEHDLAAYQAALALSKLYVANAEVIENVCWRQGRTGDVLKVKKSNVDVVMSIVGYVPDNRLNCGPQGNYNNRKYGSLKTAKFQIQLAKPFGTPFEEDFDEAIKIIGDMQQQTASTKDHRHFITSEGKYVNLRFAQNVFKRRAQKIDVDAGEIVDDETDKWPVPEDLQPDLDDLKFEYQAMPLSVYRSDKIVPVDLVSKVVKGALVEVHFELHHYHIRNKESSSDFDSFNATIEQVIVLQPGEAPVDSPYKRKNVAEGPIRMVIPSIVANTETAKDGNKGSAAAGPSRLPLLREDDGGCIEQ